MQKLPQKQTPSKENKGRFNNQSLVEGSDQPQHFIVLTY